MARKQTNPNASDLVGQAWRLAQSLEAKRITPTIANSIASQHKTILETVKVVKSMHIKGAAPKTISAFKA